MSVGEPAGPECREGDHPGSARISGRPGAQPARQVALPARGGTPPRIRRPRRTEGNNHRGRVLRHRRGAEGEGRGASPLPERHVFRSQLSLKQPTVWGLTSGGVVDRVQSLRAAFPAACGAHCSRQRDRRLAQPSCRMAHRLQNTLPLARGSLFTQDGFNVVVYRRGKIWGAPGRAPRERLLAQLEAALFHARRGQARSVRHVGRHKHARPWRYSR
jgi:hypothetical protein